MQKVLIKYFIYSKQLLHSVSSCTENGLYIDSIEKIFKCLKILSSPKFESAGAENSVGGIEQIFKRRGLEKKILLLNSCSVGP
jgi:hypothetical protein